MKTINSDLVFLNDVSNFSSWNFPKNSEIIDVEYDSTSYFRFYYLSDSDFSESRTYNFILLKENHESYQDLTNFKFLKKVSVKEFNLDIKIGNNFNNQSKFEEVIIDEYFIFYEKVLTPEEEKLIHRKKVISTVLDQ